MKRSKKIVRLVSLKNERFKVTYLFCLVIIISLFGRLVNLQVFNANDLKKKARLIQSTKTTSLRTRRSIVDRNNRLVAYDKPLYKLWAHPQYFNFPGDSINTLRGIPEVVKKISPILGLKDEILLAKFDNNNVGIELIDQITEEEAKNKKSSNH